MNGLDIGAFQAPTPAGSETTLTATPPPAPTAAPTMALAVTPAPAPTATPLPAAGRRADINGDGIVDVSDLARIGLKWHLRGTPGWIPEDVNQDGIIDVSDLATVGLHWGPVK